MKPLRRRHDPETAALTRDALALRNAGATYSQISHRLGIAASTAHAYVTDALTAIPAEEAAQLRQVEVERLDQLQRAIWAKALDGDLAATREVVRIIDRRIRLLGLDAPTSVAVGVGNVDITATVTRILNELADTINEDDE